MPPHHTDCFVFLHCSFFHGIDEKSKNCTVMYDKTEYLIIDYSKDKTR